MQDQDIIFGGEKKLEAAIQEAYEIFHPKAIAIFATCPVGSSATTSTPWPGR